MQKDKSPGNDGLKKEIYKLFGTNWGTSLYILC